ncbi:ankyrin repeat domain-containing protein [Limnobacter parvus]|uniref:Ankyrin repeat domain-containing protein n=1 Tax=Limnobacter parvus TaxID=2939690 RepID=A0ABT1XEH8_9BURK|nr:ankyrin repeat domain-containing protein [Limnobacter parvus]MCR2745678.1 ankyrin repeat domain-containing protein [Limnobacter parvus]
MIQGSGETPPNTQRVDNSIHSNSPAHAERIHLANLSPEALCEHLLNQVTHPDFSAIRSEKKAAYPELTYMQIQDRVLEDFQQHVAHRELASAMVSTIRTLADLFPNPADQQAIYLSLNKILERSGLTGLSTASFNGFGRQTVSVLELTCLRLKQLAHLANFTRLNPDKVKGQNPIGILQDALRNIAEEAKYCAPGLIQKTENIIVDVKMRLFPPSLDKVVQTLRTKICRQLIRDFCDQTYSHEQTYENSEVHYVAAWQNKIRSTQSNYSFLPEVDDLYAPNLTEETDIDTQMETLVKKLDKHACLSEVFIDIGLETLNELRSTLGSKGNDLSQYYSQFSDAVRALNTLYQNLKESDFIDFASDAITPKLTSRPDLSATRLLSNHLAADFKPAVISQAEHATVLNHERLYWTGSAEPQRGELISRVSLEDLGDTFLSNVLNSPNDQGHAHAELLVETIHHADSESVEKFANSNLGKQFGLQHSLKAAPEGYTDRNRIRLVLAMAMFSRQDNAVTQANHFTRFGLGREDCLKALAVENASLSLHDPQAVKHLIADFTKQDRSGWQLVFDAIEWNHCEIMEGLLIELTRAGRLPASGRGMHPETTSHAVRNNKMRSAAAMLKHTGHLNTRSTEFGHILHHLVYNGDLAGVRYVLANGTNPDVKATTYRGKVSALRLAIERDKIDVVRELVNCGANLQETWKSPINTEMNPLRYAELSGKHQIAILLKQEQPGLALTLNNRDTDELICAIEGENYLGAAQQLYVQRMLDRHFYKGKTILHLAAIKGDVLAIRYAAARGANLEGKSSSLTLSKTPLIHAIKHGHVDAVRELLGHGANPNAKIGNRKAIDYAVTRGNNTIINLIYAAVEQNMRNQLRAERRVANGEFPDDPPNILG